MKKEKLEKWILLEQSGELSSQKLRLLERELTSSKNAQALRIELRTLTNAVVQPDVELSPWTVTKIDARLRRERRAVLNLKPILAVAAGLAVITGIMNFHGDQTSSTPAIVIASAGVDVWSDPLEKDLNKVENLILAISGTSLDIMEM